MQSTTLAAPPLRRDYLREVAASTPIPDDVAALRGAKLMPKWCSDHRLPIDLLTGGKVLHGRGSCERRESKGNEFCSCADPSNADRIGLGHLRSLAQRVYSAEKSVVELATILRSPDVTWKDLGAALDHLHFAIYWARRYETGSPERHDAVLASDRLRPVYEQVSPVLDVAANWYDHLMTTRIPETWTGADRTPHLAVVWSFDDDQTFAPGRRFLVAGSQVVATGPDATVRLVEGRNTARILRGTYGDHTPGSLDAGEDDWLMHPVPASWTGPGGEARFAALAVTLTPRAVRPLSEMLALVEAAFL